MGIRHVFFDFDGVFTDNSVYVHEGGAESVKSSRFDGYGLRLLDELDITYSIISSEENQVATWRAKKLRIPIAIGISDKVEHASRFLKSQHFEFAQCAFLGNDINDIPLLKLVGYPACVADSWFSVINHCKYKTLRTGGDGAVREFCEHIATRVS